MLPKIPNGWLFSTAPISHHHLMRLRLGWDAQGLYRIDRAKSGLEKRIILTPLWLQPFYDPFPLQYAWSPYKSNKRPEIMESYNEFHEYIPVRPSNPFEVEYENWSITLYMPKEWRGPPMDGNEGSDLLYMPLLPPEMK